MVSGGCILQIEGCLKGKSNIIHYSKILISKSINRILFPILTLEGLIEIIFGKIGISLVDLNINFKNNTTL
jgi:hypothetical protein